jgi:diacylglycerol kinase (ATP)
MFDGRIRSFKFALKGLQTVLKTQRNAWIHAVATLAVVFAGVVLGVTHLEWCLLVVAMMAVWTAEALNTSLELLADVASPEFHPMVGQAKDVAAGAVLLSAVGSVVIGVLVLGPRCLRMMGTGL